MQRGKTSIFATFGGHLGFLWKMKKCEYLEKHERQSYFVRMFDPQGSLTYFLHLNSKAETIIRTSRLVGYQSTSRRQCYEVG